MNRSNSLLEAPSFRVGSHQFTESFSDIADIWKPLQRADKKIKPGQLRLEPEPVREFPAAVNHPLEREWGNGSTISDACRDCGSLERCGSRDPHAGCEREAAIHA